MGKDTSQEGDSTASQDDSLCQDGYRTPQLIWELECLKDELSQGLQGAILFKDSDS